MMFETTFERASLSLTSLRESVYFNDRVRRRLADGTLTLPPDIEVPRDTENWRRADYCGVMTRLYSIYEWLVHALVAEQLSIFSECLRYNELPERVTGAHRAGVGRILATPKGRRFENLSVAGLVRDFGAALANENPYRITPDAFVLHDRNLRLEELSSVLTECGVTAELSSWLKSNPVLKSFLRTGAVGNDAGKILSDLVDRRNEAAHEAEVDETLGAETLVDYIRFVECLSRALFEVFCHTSIEVKATHGDWNKIGRVTEVNGRDHKIFVAVVGSFALANGDVLYLRGNNTCFPTKVLSIQINGDVVPSIISAKDVEVGIEGTARAYKSLEVYVRSNRTSVAATLGGGVISESVNARAGSVINAPREAEGPSPDIAAARGTEATPTVRESVGSSTGGKASPRPEPSMAAVPTGHAVFAPEPQIAVTPSPAAPDMKHE